MDAWISDPWLTPEDSTQRYTERVVRFSSGRFCYTPPDDAPTPRMHGGDAIVFASFNRLAKLNTDVVATWSAILQRTPGRAFTSVRACSTIRKRARTRSNASLRTASMPIA